MVGVWKKMGMDGQAERPVTQTVGVSLVGLEREAAAVTSKCWQDGMGRRSLCGGGSVYVYMCVSARACLYVVCCGVAWYGMVWFVQDGMNRTRYAWLRLDGGWTDDAIYVVV